MQQPLKQEILMTPQIARLPLNSLKEEDKEAPSIYGTVTDRNGNYCLFEYHDAEGKQSTWVSASSLTFL